MRGAASRAQQSVQRCTGNQTATQASKGNAHVRTHQRQPSPTLKLLLSSWSMPRACARRSSGPRKPIASSTRSASSSWGRSKGGEQKRRRTCTDGVGATHLDQGGSAQEHSVGLPEGSVSVAGCTWSSPCSLHPTRGRASHHAGVPPACCWAPPPASCARGWPGRPQTWGQRSTCVSCWHQRMHTGTVSPLACTSRSQAQLLSSSR